MKSRRAITRLPEVLDVPTGVVEQAVMDTEVLFAIRAEQAEADRRLAVERAEAEWRAAFQPHGVIVTSETRPTQITISALTGGPARWRMINLDLSRPPVTFPGQVVDALPAMTRSGVDGRRFVTFFGEALGFVVNYEPDRAIRFALDGTPIEVMPKAYRIGHALALVG